MRDRLQPAKVAALVCALVAITSNALAQAPAAEPAANDVSGARLHYSKANRLFDLQRYSEAAHEYEAAYEAKDDPALLFNIGQAYRLAGDYQKAMGAYKSYLRRSPHPKNRAELETRIAELQKLVIEQRRTNEAPPIGNEQPSHELDAHETQTAQPAQPGTTTHAAVVDATATNNDRSDGNAGRGKRLAGIVLLAGGGAGLIAGGTLTGLAYQIQHQQSVPAPNTVYSASANSRMRAEQISGGVLLGVGAGAALAGVVSYVLGRREASRARGPVALIPYVAPGGAGLVLGGVLR